MTHARRRVHELTPGGNDAITALALLGGALVLGDDWRLGCATRRTLSSLRTNCARHARTHHMLLRAEPRSHPARSLRAAAFLLVDAAHALCPGSFLQARPLIHPLSTSPAGPRLSIAKTPAGLVNSRSCGEFYTQDLRPEDVQILLASGKSDKSLWAMAQLDAEEKGVTPDDYLASVQKELLDFFQKREDGSREVWDRVQLLEALRSALATTGQLAMLLGGKNCGKSTVLKNVAGTAEILMWTGQVGRVLCVARARSSANAHPRALLHRRTPPLLALYKDFLFPRLRFLFLFCFYFSPLTGDFSHISPP